MRYLSVTTAIVCVYVVTSKFRIDGGEEANFNEWPFVCFISFYPYGTLVTDPYTEVTRFEPPPNTNMTSNTCLLIQYQQKFYALTAAHMLASQNKFFVANNTQIKDNYVAFVAGYFTIEFGSALKTTINSALVPVDGTNVKLPLQYAAIMQDYAHQAKFAYDFLLVEVQHHTWYEQRNAQFLDISRYAYNGSETLVQCKMAGWGRKNGEFPESLQETDIHMFDKDRCYFYFDHWAMLYQYCYTVGVDGDPVCYDTSPRASLQYGDSGAPIMCINGRQTVLAAIHGIYMPILIGGINVTIRAGAPANRIVEFLALINS